MMVAWGQWKWRKFRRREEKIAREPDSVGAGRQEGKKGGARERGKERLIWF